MARIPLALLFAAGLGSCAFGVCTPYGGMRTPRIVIGVLCLTILCGLLAWKRYENG